MVETDKRVILRVQWGPLASHKTVLEPGRSVRVGRTDPSNLVVAKDEQMSAVHFEIGFDGAKCHLRDLKSAKGTWLDGQRVSESEVPHGGWIRAGETDFTVYFEGRTPPRADAVVPDLPDLEARKARALEALHAEAAKGSLFVILDAARDDRLIVLLREAVEECRSLYDGIQGEAMAHAAPHLVRLPKGSRFLDRLVGEGWGNAWGVYLTCRLSLKEMRSHLRRHLMVTEEETGQPLYFRFYDPRVLPLVLPAFTVRQEAEFFGAIESFHCESETGDILRLRPRGAGATRGAT